MGKVQKPSNTKYTTFGPKIHMNSAIFEWITQGPFGIFTETDLEVQSLEMWLVL
jgi:hypothetical protein